MSRISSEEEFERIKEAVDENFFPNDLYSGDKLEKKLKHITKPAYSCHPNRQEVLNNPLSIRVTPEFQMHVSKHLSRLLDEMIDDTKIILKSRKLKAGYLNSGVKLLSSSKGYLVPSNNSKTVLKPKKFSKKTLSESDYKKRAKEVAVTSEWVISQKDTKYWAPNTKGKIEIVKINNHCIKADHK